jgi:hypothetical protein
LQLLILLFRFNKSTKKQKEVLQMLKLIGFGFLTGPTPFDSIFDKFELDDLKALGFSRPEAKSLKQNLTIATNKERTVIDLPKSIRSNRFDSHIYFERNNSIRRFLEDPSHSILSDRIDQSCTVNGEENVRFRFLRFSISQMHEKLVATTQIEASESTLRKLLKTWKHLKVNTPSTTTAVCVHCDQLRKFTRSIERHPESMIREFFFGHGCLSELVLCGHEVRTYRCLEFNCDRCGSLAFLRRKIEHTTIQAFYENDDLWFGYQLWQVNSVDQTSEVVDKFSEISEFTEDLYQWIRKSKYPLHRQVVLIQNNYIKTLKSVTQDGNIVTILDQDNLVIRIDQAMRPLQSNNHELQAMHFRRRGFPVLGVLITWKCKETG